MNYSRMSKNKKGERKGKNLVTYFKGEVTLLSFLGHGLNDSHKWYQMASHATKVSHNAYL